MFMPKIEDFRTVQPVTVQPVTLQPAADLVAALSRRTATTAPGVLAGTLVETPAGWRPVETLAAGDRIATLDGGFCQLLGVTRQRLHAMAGQEVIHVPGGVLDACSALDVMPEQGIFLASRIAEEVLGAAGVLVPARVLAGHFGITRRTIATTTERIVLHFAREEIVFANSGFLIHAAPEGQEPGEGFFDRLDADRAEAMLALIAGAGAPVFARAA